MKRDKRYDSLPISATSVWRRKIFDEFPQTLRYITDCSNEAVAGVSVDENGQLHLTGSSRGETPLEFGAILDRRLADKNECKFRLVGNFFVSKHP